MTSTPYNWPVKGPNDTLDYSLDWGAELALHSPRDTVASAVWTVPADLTVGQQSIAGAVTTVWLSGGQAGQDYLVACRMTTGAGRVIERTVKLLVRPQ